MKPDIRDFARLGLVHHLLYPTSMSDPDYHAETLCRFVKRDDIQTLDLCIPYGEKRRAAVIEAIRSCDKEVVYSLHLFPLGKISLGSLSPVEQAQARLIVEDQVQVAAAAGATGFVFGSGRDVPKQRPQARRVFADFCRWFCGKLKPHGMVALLEPFDRTFDKRFLYGPTAECVDLIRSLAPEVHNLRIELDVAHLPLMGESFSGAFRTVAPYLTRVHLGNCVKRDSSHPWYGDKHPPLGLKGGEVDVPQLVDILRVALDIGYLSREDPKPLVLEMMPFPGKTVEETISDGMKRLEEAWRRL